MKILLDLFCCAGAASVGYHRAGFKVVGVDNKPQPNYPFEFRLADAMEFLKEHGSKADVIHASPPCQGYSPHTKNDSQWVSYSKGKEEPQLIDVVRDLMPEGILYVIENVPGAKEHLVDPFVLCGSMFGLPIPRHRYFESNINITPPEHPKCRGIAKRYSEEHGIDYRDMSVTGKGRRAGTSERWKSFMGIDWHMTQSEIVEAIPPVYSEFIGKAILNEINKS